MGYRLEGGNSWGEYQFHVVVLEEVEKWLDVVFRRIEVAVIEGFPKWMVVIEVS